MGVGLRFSVMEKLLILSFACMADASDDNDNSPYFDRSQYEADVDEHENVGHTVLTITANDMDSASRLQYELRGGNTGGAFSVSFQGAIFVEKPLDYETVQRVSRNIPTK